MQTLPFFSYRNFNQSLREEVLRSMTPTQAATMRKDALQRALKKATEDGDEQIVAFFRAWLAGQSRPRLSRSQDEQMLKIRCLAERIVLWKHYFAQRGTPEMVEGLEGADDGATD